MKSLSRVQLFATPWTVAHQAPPSMGFSRQEYWSGLPQIWKLNAIVCKWYKTIFTIGLYLYVYRKITSDKKMLTLFFTG